MYQGHLNLWKFKKFINCELDFAKFPCLGGSYLWQLVWAGVISGHYDLYALGHYSLLNISRCQGIKNK
jgi:hypothetical protein